MAAAMGQTRSSCSDEEEEYEVEKIVGMCESKGETLYKVRWLNYSPSWDTWEPYGNLESCREMMMEYRKKHEKQLARQKDKRIFEDDEEHESMVEYSGTTRKPKQKKNTFVYVSSDEEEANTLKDRFWHDLDQGKINILDGSDLYSKIKSQGRSARPQSFENMFKDLRRGPSHNGETVKVHLKRNASVSSGKKSGRPFKALKNHDKGGKKVTTHCDVVMTKMKIDAVTSKNSDVVMTKMNSDTVTPKNSDSRGDNLSTRTPDSSDEVDTIKDSFWRDLEEGKINVFSTDLYTKVKGPGRSARPKSFQNMFRRPRITKENKEVAYSYVPSVKVKLENGASADLLLNPSTVTECVDVAADDHLVDEEISPVSSRLTSHSNPDVEEADSVSPPVDKVGQGIDPEVSVSVSDCQSDDSDNMPLRCHVTSANRDSGLVQSAEKSDEITSKQDLYKSEVVISAENSPLQITSEVSPVASNSCMSCVEPVTSEASPVSVSLPVSSKTSPTAGYSCPRVPLVEQTLTNNTLTYSDAYTVTASAHSNIVDLPACSKQTSGHNNLESERLCTSSGQIKPTSGMSASLSSLIHLNARPMENELNRGAVSGDTLRSRSSSNTNSRSVLPLMADSMSMAPSVEYAKSVTYTMENPMSVIPFMEDTRSRTCLYENPKSVMPLMDGLKSSTLSVEYPRSTNSLVEIAKSGVPQMKYPLPNISSINPRSNASVERSKLQMSFEECVGSRTSLVDWDGHVSSSVFHINGAVNVAPSCQLSSMSGTQGFPEHEMSFTPTLDFTHDVSMGHSTCMLTDAAVFPLGNHVCVDSVIPFVDYNHRKASKFRVENCGQTLQNSGAPVGLDCNRGAAFRSVPGNPQFVEYTRETVGHSNSKPPTTGYSQETHPNPGEMMSSADRNTGVDNLQHHIDGGTYASNDRLQDIDERFPMSIQAGMRQEYVPPKKSAKTEKQEEDDMLELDFDIEPMKATVKASKMKCVKTIAELTNVDILHAVQTNDCDTAEWALESGVFDLDQRDVAGLTLTMIAARQGYDDILEVLVLHGANVNAATKTGVTALFLATEMGLRCTVELLLLLGAHMNVRIQTLETALIKAIKLGHRNIVKLLLDHGANFGCPQNDNRMALEYASTCKSPDCHDLISRHIARLTAEFENQMLVTLNKTAKIVSLIFPMQCFTLCEGHKFKVMFHHELQPTRVGAGMLLFIAHTLVTPSKVQCRFYGASAVTAVTLNGVALHAVTKESNFVMSFSPVQDRVNELVIHAVHAPTSKMKLVVCAYKVQLM